MLSNFEALERTRVKVVHSKVQKLLREAGARVNEDSQVVKFPPAPALVERMLRTVSNKEQARKHSGYV